MATESKNGTSGAAGRNTGTTRRRTTGTTRAPSSRSGQTATQRSATAKRGAATRQRRSAGSSARSTKGAARRTATSARTTARSAATTARRSARAETTRIEALATQAERAVLIPVGAALTARDRLVETVGPYTRPQTAQRELKKLRRQVDLDLRKFERRGVVARNRVARVVKRDTRNIETQVKGARRDFSRGAGRLGSAVTDAAEDARKTLA